VALIIEQQFPLGRFHATRWNQGAFGDAYGEWPPSPWRLLRALAMRWFQYARETGDADTTIRDGLLQSLASSLPAYSLPPSTWRGPALKQYQPTNIDWTDKSKAAAGYKKPQTTLVEDHYRALAPDESIFWCWENLDLAEPQQQLLTRLLERTLYFGRAESFSRLRRVAELPAGAELNCRLEKHDKGTMIPVLVHLPERPLDLAVLLASTDDKELKGQSIPPGTAWYYAKLPRQPISVRSTTHHMKYPEHLSCVQFAVGGRVFPPLGRWVKVTDRFRGRVIRHLSAIAAPESQGHYDLLTSEQKDELSLICGKDGQGQPLRGHRHAFFLLWPDENGLPTRLIVWRSSPFTSDEVKALLAASEFPIAWDNGVPEWRVRLVPLPYEMPAPRGFLSESRIWESVTPFVPPSERHRFRKNGRERPGESVDRLLTKLLLNENKPAPERVTVFKGNEDAGWINLHETRNRRILKADSRTPWVRPGFRVRIEFPSPVTGPIILGDSCHFGLGLFAPIGGE
jgi:CRISPR-associated protein Csb2